VIKEKAAMNYNFNVIKFVWRQLRKPSRATLDAIISQNPQQTPLTQTLDSAVWQQISRLEAVHDCFSPS
jgi:hypothetical protein